MSMNQNGMETYMMKTTKRHLIILMMLFLSLFGVCNVSWGHVYWKPTNGNDNNNGSTENLAVKTWTRAKSLLSGQDNNQQIYLCERLTFSSTTTLDGAISGKANARVRRNMTDFMFAVNGGVTLTLKNITITGEMHSNNPHWDNTKSIIATSGVVVLDNGTVLRDNYVTADVEPFAGAVRIYDKGTLTMETGSLISNCRAERSGSTVRYEGGAIMCGGSCTVNINGGTIENCTAKDIGGAICLRSGTYTFNMTGGIIKGCSAPSGGGIYIAPIKKEDNTYTSVIATVKLTGGKIENCTAANAAGDAGYGGGVYIDCNSGTSTFKMISESGSSGTEISGCNAITLGGGIYSGRTTPAASSTLTLTLTKGKIHDCRAEGPNPNDGKGRGGALAITGGVVTNINGSGFEMYDNYAKYYGGGIQLSNSTLYFSKGEIYGNEAGHGAAGIHVSRSGTNTTTFNMSGGKLYENETPGVGGGIHSSEGCTLSITGGEIYDNIAHTQGGGININTRCNLEIPENSTLEMYGNSACRGGAIMVDGATLTIHAGSYHDNQALDSYTPSESNVQVDTYGTGGAFCLVTANNTNTSASECNLYGGTLDSNTASRDGGAIYIGETTSGTTLDPPAPLDDDPEMHILGAATISNNSALNGHGGGIYMASGTFEMTDGTIDGNSAAQDGGGFYVTTPTGKTSQVDISGGSIINNSATYGGGFAVVGGTCDIKGAGVSIGASGNANTATYGGGLYADGGTTTITKGNVQYNEASQDGGGIYANGGTVNVQYAATTDGKIHHNYAGQRGGGLFISSSGSLNLEGNTTLEYNRVPEGELGGGVYLEGTVQAGASSTDVIIVKDNYASNTVVASSSDITASIRNNIYLPNPTDGIGTTPPETWPGVITVVNNGLNLASSKVGFSVPHNFVPVVYCKTTSYLSGGTQNIMSSDAVFEDSERYNKYYSTASPYKANFIYLSADTWFAAVPSQPSGFSYENIDSPEDLAWLISLVNGRTTPSAVTASTLSDITVKLTADIDMKAHTWVPIGFTGKSFNGIFDGNGHTISNVYCSYLGEGEGGTGRGLGLFGTVENATIHDVFVNGVELQVKNQTGSDAYTMGAIANEAKGTTSIYNCTAASKMESTIANTTMGGLVGKLTSGTIHSSAAMPAMTGYQMGGLVGQMASGTNLYNSFANGRFTAQTGSDKYMGGLVGVNAGRIENCYARIQNAANPSSNYFGWIAGQNNSGTVTYCYIPTTDYGATYVKDGTAAANNCTSFGPTSTPYQYKHADNQMTANSNNGNIVNGAFDRNGLKGLLATLNKWVGSSATYAKWMRTSASPINGDYPIHNYTDYVCVGSKDNVTLEYSADFNTKFKDYITANSGTIYLYQSPTAAVTSTLSNSSGVPALYIHEDVVMMHSSAIKAHVGITLDNSAGTIGAHPSFSNNQDAIDWHFFSSALTNSPIGLHYGAVDSPTEDNSTYNAYEYPDWHATFTNANGYFPLNLNDYYADWDLYAYCEPDYHWINLKRNSASHWHEDSPGEHITYDNDTEFVPGKGYMVALKDEGYLQAYGTLNTNTGTGSDFLTVPVSYTPEIAWTTREGHNLLGNPYQSYLDFNAFARDEQNATLWNAGRTPFYIIMDEDQADYVLYTVGQSPNESQASRFLHPHQGFMIDVDKAGNARFSNDMRTTTTTVSESGTETTWPGYFRSESNPCYPLVNLFATDSYGNRDIVTVELGRPDKGGALKQDAWRMGKGSLWCRYEDEDYALVFTQPGLEYANIRFSCDEDGEYTMTWNTQNGEFSYLHLIDNLTGADIDCLTASEYRFSARESDYNSRFRLVFDYTGIDDHEVPEPVEGPATFAYYANGEIHLMATPDATAQLQIIDMTGRTIVSRDGVHTVSTTGLAAGVYVLRLTDGNGTRTQKIILN